jgi:uracil-DNA glycosylase
MSLDVDAPFSLADPVEVARRRAMLSLPHMVPLVTFIAGIKGEIGRDLPMFDPCDGGVKARLLFLLEAPGPKAVASSFISRNNPDQTAKNFNLLLREAELPRRDCALWNIVPWYIGTGERIRAAKRADVVAGLPYLAKLLSRLPELRAIVLVGKAAGSAAHAIGSLSTLPVFSIGHPSPKVFNVYPQKRVEALQVLKSLRRYMLHQT